MNLDINDITVNEYREQTDHGRRFGARTREATESCWGAQAYPGQLSHQEVCRAPIRMSAGHFDRHLAASHITGGFAPVTFITDDFDAHVDVVGGTHAFESLRRAR